MTDAEWLASTKPRPMLVALRGRAGERKFRLFAAACCRRAWHRMDDPRSRHLVETAELFADGLIAGADYAAAVAGGEVAHREATRIADAAKRLLDERVGDLSREVACHAAGAANHLGA